MMLLDEQQRQRLLEQLGSLLRDNTALQQALAEADTKHQAGNEELFIELLELFDALESLMTYVDNNSEAATGPWKRLPKSLLTVQKKLLTLLERRQVIPIEIKGSDPDFKICQVVDREIRDDIEDNTITKVVRQGFRVGDKILRPVEVITSKKP